MATRRIRLTMSGDVLNDINAIVDIDFNGVNLDTDLEITGVKGSTTMVKEYSVDVDAGEHSLSVEYKNDGNTDVGDRNFYIERIEIANDGTNFENYAACEEKSNLTEWTNFQPHGWTVRANPDYDETQPRVFPTNYHRMVNPSRNDSIPYTDATWYNDTGFLLHYGHTGDPGNNSKFLYEWVQHSVVLYENAVATFTIDFT